MQKAIVDIKLEYCAPCGYTERAVTTANDILGEREMEVYIRSFQLIPGSQGVFEVDVNGERVFSKKDLGRHAEPGEVKDLVQQKMQDLLPE
jgi:selenoprotein W-related protein